METVSNTVSNITAGVSKLVYGDQTTENETAGQEPVNGQQGKGTADEPYDQGNAQSATPANETGGLEPISGVKGKGTVDEPFDQGNSESSTGAAAATTSSNTYIPTSNYTGDKPMTTAVKPTSPVPNITSPHETAVVATSPQPEITPPSSNMAGIEVTHSNTSAPTTGFAESGIVPTEQNPATSLSNTDTGAPALQGSHAPTAEPNATEVAAIKESKDKAESSLSKKDVAEEIGKVHDESLAKNQTSGVAAEGGNFDAAKPGAGQEAKRVVEGHESKKETTGAGSGSAATKTSSEDSVAHGKEHSGEGKEKTSLKDKVKEKLHIKKH